MTYLKNDPSLKDIYEMINKQHIEKLSSHDCFNDKKYREIFNIVKSNECYLKRNIFYHLVDNDFVKRDYDIIKGQIHKNGDKKETTMKYVKYMTLYSEYDAIIIKTDNETYKIRKTIIIDEKQSQQNYVFSM